MFRIGILWLALAGSPALAQETDAERRALADAFTVADLDTLGECQGRVEGMVRMAQEFSPWYASQQDTAKVEGLRKAEEQAIPLATRMSDLRTGVARLVGNSLETSNAARVKTLALFERRDGEDTRAAYARWQPQTVLPQECRDAMKRARVKLELDGETN